MARLVAVVTGAAQGIGHATATLLAQRGYAVACLDINVARAAEDPLLTAANGHLWVAADVADEAQMAAAFQQIAAQYGRLDALAAVAGVIDRSPLEDIPVDAFRRVLDINVVGVYLAIREAAKLMTSGASIVVVSSVAGLRGGGLLGTAAYAASKGAVTALGKSAARSLTPRGIRVNVVAPGLTESPMTADAIHGELHDRLTAAIPAGRAAAPEEIANVVAFLLSPEASYVVGSTVVVDGGVCMY